MPETFRHTRLNEPSKQIRLLSIHKPEDGEEAPVECTLQTFNSLKECPKYHALSYMWGSAASRKQISINGKKFHIRRNLYDFLKRIQVDWHEILAGEEKYDYTHQTMKRNPPFLLWIDAICIDQSSIPERNAQVQLMGDIYRNADAVLIWLGEPDSDDITHLHDTFKGFWEAGRNLSSYWNGQMAQAEDVDWQETWDWAGGDDRVDWEFFEKICTLPYWRRAWIHQEVSLARTWYLLYGAEMLSREVAWHVAAMRVWKDARRKHARPLDAEDHGKATKMSYLMLQNGEDPQMYLRDLLVEYRNCECERIHDRVYALLDLAVDGAQIVVDYSSSQAQLCRDIGRLKAKDHPGVSPWDALKNHPDATKLRRSKRKHQRNFTRAGRKKDLLKRISLGLGGEM